MMIVNIDNMMMIIMMIRKMVIGDYDYDDADDKDDGDNDDDNEDDNDNDGDQYDKYNGDDVNECES